MVIQTSPNASKTDNHAGVFSLKYIVYLITLKALVTVLKHVVNFHSKYVAEVPPCKHKHLYKTISPVSGLANVQETMRFPLLSFITADLISSLRCHWGAKSGCTIIAPNQRNHCDANGGPSLSQGLGVTLLGVTGNEIWSHQLVFHLRRIKGEDSLTRSWWVFVDGLLEVGDSGQTSRGVVILCCCLWD